MVLSIETCLCCIDASRCNTIRRKNLNEPTNASNSVTFMDCHGQEICDRIKEMNPTDKTVGPNDSDYVYPRLSLVLDHSTSYKSNNDTDGNHTTNKQQVSTEDYQDRDHIGPEMLSFNSINIKERGG